MDISERLVSQLNENQMEILMRGVKEAYENRDTDAFLSYFAEDGIWTIPEGSYRGKEAIRQVLSRLDQYVPDRQFRDTGIGIIIKNNVGIWERIEETITADGRKSIVPGVSLFEFNGDKIHHLRVYIDRLTVAQQAAKGWMEKRIINAIINQMES
jgi:ketosteroid isomerase-like protein